jgi:tripartite-type tricarboxylate transporter receptor subunit TctC
MLAYNGCAGNHEESSMKSLLTAAAIFGAAAAFVPSLAAGQVAPGASPAQDQTAPAAPSGRVIRFILPVATGSGVDTITRAAAPALSRALGGNVVVENQPGAGGVIGTSAMIRSAPDGNTLSVVSNNHVIYPSVLKTVPFDPVKDITPIAIMGTTPIVLVANPKVEARNSKELVALLKARPGQVNYGSSGNGTILHLAAQQFLDAAGVKATHVPYKGVGPMVTDLLGGQVEFGAVALPSVQGHLKSGALRAIGVATKDRVAAAPEIPTFLEQGLQYVSEAWFAVVGPKGLPPADVKRIHAAVVEAFGSAEVKDAMARQGNAIAISSPEAAAKHFAAELDKYAALVKKAGLEPQ